MTEKFSCPEPSAEARRAYIDALNAEPGTLGSVLAAAYAVDVPRIVREEVRRALRARQEDVLGFSVAAYLTERFGEAAPERCIICEGKGWVEGSSMRVQCVCAPTERREPRAWAKTEVWLSRDEVERRFGVKVTPDGQTQAERAFLRALARLYDIQTREMPDVSGAARRVVEEVQ